MMKIRPLVESDGPAVIALWTSVFAYPAPHNDPAESLRRKLAVQPELLFVATVDDRLVGTVMGGYDGHRGWIYSLCVEPGFRRRGLGTALMQHVERELARRDCPKINFQVLASNAATTPFYEKLGYTIEDRISMGKVVGPSRGQ